MQGHLPRYYQRQSKASLKRRSTEHFATSEEHDGKLHTSFTGRLFAQRDLGRHLSIFPAFLCLAIWMRRIDWGAERVVGRWFI